MVHALQRPPLLPLGLLLLPPRQFAQALQQLVDFLVGLLLLRPVSVLVTRGQLVELLLEDLGQFLLHLAATATATAATACGHLRLVLLFCCLQQLQRPVLGAQRALGIGAVERLLGLAHRLDGLWQQVGDSRKRRIALHQLAVHPRDQAFHLLAELRLRECHDD